MTDKTPTPVSGIDLVEQIAQQWDGCEYDSAGEGLIDIGDAIRRAGFLLAQPVIAAPVEAPQWEMCMECDGRGEMHGSYRCTECDGSGLVAAPQAPSVPTDEQIDDAVISTGILDCLQDPYDAIGNGNSYSSVLRDARRIWRLALAAQPSERPAPAGQADPWRQAVDDALIAHALDCTGPGDDPREKVKELLDWAVTIATDPRVSEQTAIALRPSASAVPEASATGADKNDGWKISVVGAAMARAAGKNLPNDNRWLLAAYNAVKADLATPTPTTVQAEEPVSVYLVSTGEVYEGQETYTRHDSRPPLCDAERLFASPYGEPVDVATLAEAAYDAAIKYANGHEVDWTEVIESAIRGIGTTKGEA